MESNVSFFKSLQEILHITDDIGFFSLFRLIGMVFILLTFYKLFRFMNYATEYLIKKSIKSTIQALNQENHRRKK